MKKVLLIGGTPGVGKSRVAEILTTRLKGTMLSLGKFAQEKNLIDHEDPKRHTLVVNQQKLVNAIQEWIHHQTGWVIIESHFIDILLLSNIHLVVILRTHPFEIKKRLEQRKWGRKKVTENVQAETLGVCIADAKHAFSNFPVIEINTSDTTPTQIANQIVALLNLSETKLLEHTQTKYDWLLHLTAPQLDSIFQRTD